MPRKSSEPAATPEAVKKKPIRRKNVVAPAEPNWEHVATRAYYLHLEQGGDAVENWLRAEREVVAA